jgi:hypothetical protein
MFALEELTEQVARIERRQESVASQRGNVETISFQMAFDVRWVLTGRNKRDCFAFR